MHRSAALLSSAVLALGLAAGAMAANMPQSAAPTATDTPATPAADARKAMHKHKKHKKTATTSGPAAAK